MLRERETPDGENGERKERKQLESNLLKKEEKLKSLHKDTNVLPSLQQNHQNAD